MAYAVRIEVLGLPSGTIVVQRTPNLEEFAELLYSAGQPREYREAHFEEYQRRQVLPPGRPASNLSWRSIPADQPWVISIFTDNHTQAVCLLAAELVHLGEQLSRHRAERRQPATIQFRATVARLVFKQFYARSVLQEQFEARPKMKSVRTDQRAGRPTQQAPE